MIAVVVFLCGVLVWLWFVVCRIRIVCLVCGFMDWVGLRVSWFSVLADFGWWRVCCVWVGGGCGLV